MSRRDVLPLSLAPRGLSRIEAAQYIGVGATLFDRLVDDGRMPKPKKVDGRVIWDRHALDLAFEALPSENPSSDPWGSVRL